MINSVFFLTLLEKAKPLSTKSWHEARLIGVIYYLRQRYFIKEKYKVTDSRIHFFVVNFRKINLDAPQDWCTIRRCESNDSMLEQ